MSTLRVTVEKVKEVSPHPNADRLEIARVLGWQCVVGKDTVKSGDLVVYFPIDSVLPDELSDKLFANSKVRPHRGRIRTTKIRGVISQGLAIPAYHEAFGGDVYHGADLTERLGVKKYEPPEEAKPPTMRGNQLPKHRISQYFRTYTDIEHLQRYPDHLNGHVVVVTEKIHGTNFRAGWVPRRSPKWWQRALMCCGVLSPWEFVWGSRTTQRGSSRDKGFGFYEQLIGVDVYTEAVKKYDLRRKIPKGITIYGEIYGDKIQKGYDYDCGPGERKLILFDALFISEDGSVCQYCDWEYVREIAEQVGVPHVPVLYIGDYSLSRIEELASGKSILGDEVREGVVVRPLKEVTGPNGRLIYKYINPEYLLNKHNTEWH